MTKIFQLHPLAKIVRYSARVHGIPELGLYRGRFAALKADIKSINLLYGRDCLLCLGGSKPQLISFLSGAKSMVEQKRLLVQAVERFMLQKQTNKDTKIAKEKDN